jgi:hypothetical protein
MPPYSESSCDFTQLCDDTKAAVLQGILACFTVMNVFGSPEMGLLMTSTEDTAIKRNIQQDIDMR